MSNSHQNRFPLFSLPGTFILSWEHKSICRKRYGTDNKFWYGSYINGDVQSVETVSTAPHPGTADKLTYKTYKLERGQWLANNAGDKASPAARISYIFSHRPSVFP